MNYNLFFALAYTYNAFVLAGTAYLVEWHNWSPWWFLFAFVALVNPRVGGEK